MISVTGSCRIKTGLCRYSNCTDTLLEAETTLYLPTFLYLWYSNLEQHKYRRFGLQPYLLCLQCGELDRHGNMLLFTQRTSISFLHVTQSISPLACFWPSRRSWWRFHKTFRVSFLDLQTEQNAQFRNGKNGTPTKFIQKNCMNAKQKLGCKCHGRALSCFLQARFIHFI